MSDMIDLCTCGGPRDCMIHPGPTDAQTIANLQAKLNDVRSFAESAVLIGRMCDNPTMERVGLDMLRIIDEEEG